MDRSQSPPIWLTIFLAVFQAVELASLGSRLDPERKKSRVKVININVRKIPQTRSIQRIGSLRVII